MAKMVLLNQTYSLKKKLPIAFLIYAIDIASGRVIKAKYKRRNANREILLGFSTTSLQFLKFQIHKIITHSLDYAFTKN